MKRHLGGEQFIAEIKQTNANWLNDYIYVDDKDTVLAAIQEAIRTKTMFELEHRV